jgi:hypothetical protein
MWQRPDLDDDAQARSLCQDLASGKSIQPYIDGEGWEPLGHSSFSQWCTAAMARCTAA